MTGRGKLWMAASLSATVFGLLIFSQMDSTRPFSEVPVLTADNVIENSAVLERWANSWDSPIRKLKFINSEIGTLETAKLMIHFQVLGEIGKIIGRQVDDEFEKRAQTDGFFWSNHPNTIIVAGMFKSDAGEEVGYTGVVMLDAGKDARVLYLSVGNEVLMVDELIREHLMLGKPRG